MGVTEYGQLPAVMYRSAGGEGVADRDWVRVIVTVTVAVPERLEPGDGVRVAVADSDGVHVGVAVSEGVRVGVADGEGVGEGESHATHASATLPPAPAAPATPPAPPAAHAGVMGMELKDVALKEEPPPPGRPAKGDGDF